MFGGFDGTTREVSAVLSQWSVFGDEAGAEDEPDGVAEKADAPAPRSAHAAAIVDSKMYSFLLHAGGQRSVMLTMDRSLTTRYIHGGQGTEPYADLVAYSFPVGVWFRLSGSGSRTPSARSGHTMVEYRSWLYLFGGYDASTGSHCSVPFYRFSIGTMLLCDGTQHSSRADLHGGWVWQSEESGRWQSTRE